MSDPLHVVVMLGGPSAEREVSLRSGAAVAGALRGLGHRVTELDPRPGAWALPAGTDVIFLALHGTYGEDGAIQAELEALGVPFTGCDATASRLAFDKVLTKERCNAAGVATPRHLVVQDRKAPWPAGWRPPLVVKPARQGSSVGLRFVDHPSGWPEALDAALRHDDAALIEERIVGPELTAGILDGRVLPLVEVRPHSGAYDYSSKYSAGATEYLCPAPLDAAATDRVQGAARRAFAAVGGRDYARVDVMLDAAGNPWVLEVNTLPGMTETSLLPKAAAAAGMPFPALCGKMVELALHRGARQPVP
ncbi:MAG: D-alanine--D-alanine ligase [Limisphaerales bacterium]